MTVLAFIAPADIPPEQTRGCGDVCSRFTGVMTKFARAFVPSAAPLVAARAA